MRFVAIPALSFVNNIISSELLEVVVIIIDNNC